MNFLSSIQEAVRASRVLGFTLFTVATVAALAIEWLLWGPPPLPAPVTLSAGVLDGALLITRRSQWPALIGLALVLRTIFVMSVEGLFPSWPCIFETVGVIAVASLVGATPWFMRRNRADEVAPNEILATGVLIALAGSMVLGLLRVLTSTSATPIAEAAVASLSLLLGLTIAGPPIVVLGRRLHAKRPRSLRRLIGMTLSIIGFLVTIFVALGHKPEAAWELLGDFTGAWLWAALGLGIVMALRCHAIVSNWIAALAATLVTVVYFHFHDVTVQETLDWQISAMGLLIILLSSTALIGGNRRANDQRRAQQAVSHIMLARAERADESSVAPGNEFERALAVAGEHAGAHQARLYWLDTDTQRMGVAHEWPERLDGLPPHETELRSVRETLAPLLLGRIVQLRTSTDRGGATAEAMSQLGLASARAALLQPIVFGGRIIGAVVLASLIDVPFRRIDVSPLLTMIAEFYVSDRTRERALASIGNYQRRLRELAARTALAEERVRRETAVELHDGLIQRLAVARMKLGELRHRAGDTEPVGAITDIVDESLATSRAIIHDLSPSVVYELGLIPGLEKLVDDLRTEGRFRLTLRQHGEGCPLEEPVRVGIYHVVQELAANSISHSGGDRVWIDVYWEQTSLDAVVVSDNGRSDAWWLAETEADEPSGLGLLSARERLRPIGYDIKFERRLGGGTRAIVFWSSPAEG